MSTTISPAEAARHELSGFKGRLIGPRDENYEDARAVYNAMIDRRPGLIARCTDADDVAAVVGFARDHGLVLAIRGGGHNGGGLGTVDDGVVADLSPLKDIKVDPDGRTVRVGGGCVWGEVDAATGEHGLATPSGIISTTGVGGLTLNGGLGGELAHQPALARTGFSTEQDDSEALTRGAGQQRAKLLELRGSPDEWKRGGETKRGRQVVHR